MGERIPRTDEVTGSNPVCSINILPQKQREFCVITMVQRFSKSTAASTSPETLLASFLQRPLWDLRIHTVRGSEAISIALGLLSQSLFVPLIYSLV